MQRNDKEKSYFKAGMYLLETLTSGMYNEPLTIYREYIQNSVDSIDIMNFNNNPKSMQVNINLDPFNHQIKIFDNGLGVPVDIAEQTLSSIGSSNKFGNELRGFRGIGRLGGIAFSDKAIYRTKARGEKVESVQEWDCKELRNILLSNKKPHMSLKEVFDRTTIFYQNNNKSDNDSYFEVTLEGVSSFRNYIFDISKVRNYLSQIAPVPFNMVEFTYSKEIDDYLSTNLSHYGRYEITLNGEKIFKPYRERIKVTKKGIDYIDNIKFFEIKIKNISAAYGWYGERRELSSSISKGDGSSGIHVRAGNILIGDAHLLDNCFREPRFNSYVIGEIHIDYPDLIPNSRRDDFIDNEAKTLFYNAIEREIGLPISKEIRLRSRMKSETKKSKTLSDSFEVGDQESDLNKNKSFPEENNKDKANKLSSNSTDLQSSKIFSEIQEICKGCPKLSKILLKIQNHKSADYYENLIYGDSITTCHDN